MNTLILYTMGIASLVVIIAGSSISISILGFPLSTAKLSENPSIFSQPSFLRTPIFTKASWDNLPAKAGDVVLVPPPVLFHPEVSHEHRLP